MAILSNENLAHLLDALTKPTAAYNELDSYWYGKQTPSYLAGDEGKLLGRLARLVSNIPRLSVLSVAERLRVLAFDGVDIATEWEAQNMAQHVGTLFRESLLLGSAHVLVSQSPGGQPVVTVESARQVAVERDPGSREVVAAVKRWDTGTTSEATLWLPDRVERWSAGRVEADANAFRLVKSWANPLGVVPVVPVVNADRLLDLSGVSEIADLMPLVQAANKLLVDLLCTSEATGLPRRWATGLQPMERVVMDGAGKAVLDEHGVPVKELVSPVSESRHKLIVAGSENTKFGQFNAADMAGFESAMRIVMAHIGAVSALPPAYLAAWDSQPTSADAVRAQESSLVARVEAKQLVFGPALEQVAALIVAVRDGVPVDSVTPRVRWGDPASRSAAQEADAAVKLYQAGVLSRSGTLRRLGFTDEQIAAERVALRAEALDGQGVTVTANRAAPVASPNEAPPLDERAA